MVPLRLRSHTSDFSLRILFFYTSHCESRQEFAKSDNQPSPHGKQKPISANSACANLSVFGPVWPAGGAGWLMSAKVKYCKEKVHQRAIILTQRLPVMMIWYVYVNNCAAGQRLPGSTLARGNLLTQRLKTPPPPVLMGSLLFFQFAVFKTFKTG